MELQHIAIVIYPGVTALDFVAPQHVFAALPNTKVHLVWKTKEPIMSDTGIEFLPSLTFEECPETLQALFVPGGASGLLALMQDQTVLNFLTAQGSRAEYITSVCTGSLLLGAAGLLNGYKATSHWLVRDLLVEFGATPIADRVVRDRNRITGAGVTAGLDFSLAIASQLSDVNYARAVQLTMEYDPKPPFSAGNPEQAGEQTVSEVRRIFAPFVHSLQAMIKYVRDS